MRVRAAWLILPLLALLEVFAHAIIRARVPEPDDYRAAARFVHTQLAPDDALVIAPGWADPLLRQHLGDAIPLAMAGRSDLSAYKRLWALSIRGEHPHEADGLAPDLHRTFGRVTVLRYPLPRPRAGYDFVAHAFDARVTLADRPCPERRTLPGRGGGLGKATVLPARRFECEKGDPRRFIAPVVLEDLSLSPRYCLYQPVHRGGPVRVAFDDVPLSDELLFYAGLYYEDERKREGAPVAMRVLIDDAPVGQLTHRDGDGFRPFAIDTRARSGQRAKVTVEVSAPRHHKRGFCWAGGVRGGP